MAIITGGVSFQIPPGGWNINGYYFDAWLRLNHNTSLTLTQHPVETGANITDHSYNNPRRFSFDIGMTNVRNDTIANQFLPSSTRSIAAYQTLVALQRSREFLQLRSKYGLFSNVLIDSIDAIDDYSTTNSGRYTINLTEVIVVDILFFKVSGVTQITDLTKRGQVSPKAIPESIDYQRFGIVLP